MFYFSYKGVRGARGTRGARGARGAARARGTKRSSRVEERSYAREEEEEEGEEEEEDLNSSHQSTSTTPQQSSTQESTRSLIIDDMDNREIIVKSRSHTPITNPESTSSPSTPVERQVELAQSRLSSPIVRQFSFDANRESLNNIESMLIKQGKQIRVLYELQRTSLEKISSLQTQVKKLNSDKNNELSSRVFNVSDNFVCIILSHLHRKLFTAILYRKDIAQYAPIYFQITCGRHSKNINVYWKNG